MNTKLFIFLISNRRFDIISDTAGSFLSLTCNLPCRTLSIL